MMAYCCLDAVQRRGYVDGRHSCNETEWVGLQDSRRPPIDLQLMNQTLVNVFSVQPTAFKRVVPTGLTQSSGVGVYRVQLGKSMTVMGSQ